MTRKGLKYQRAKKPLAIGVVALLIYSTVTTLALVFLLFFQPASHQSLGSLDEQHQESVIQEQEKKEVNKIIIQRSIQDEDIINTGDWYFYLPSRTAPFLNTKTTPPIPYENLQEKLEYLFTLSFSLRGQDVRILRGLFEKNDEIILDLRKEFLDLLLNRGELEKMQFLFVMTHITLEHSNAQGVRFLFNGHEPKSHESFLDLSQVLKLNPSLIQLQAKGEN